MSETTTTKYRGLRANIDKPEKGGAVDCGRCGGSGVYHTYGTCFRCGGKGYDPTNRQWLFPVDWTDAEIDEWNAAREAKNAKARERSAAKRKVENEATWVANVEACPELAEVTSESYAPLQDIASKAHRHELSDAQRAFIANGVVRDREIAAERAAREAAKAEIPAWEAGRQVVEGTVKTRKLVESQYGSTWKIRVVTADGRGLWVTEPSKMVNDEGETLYVTNIGDEVTLTATVEPSEDDPTFAFGKRPTKFTNHTPDQEEA